MDLQPSHISFERPEDHLMIGSIQIGDSGPFRATRFCTSTFRQTQPFRRLDAAAAWITSNPYLPDLTQYGHRDQIYGPELVRWGGYTLIGQVWSYTSNVTPGMGSLQDFLDSPFVVMSQEGRVCARVVQVAGTWKLSLTSSDGKTLRRQRARLGDALKLLCVEVAQRLDTASHHERMHRLHQLPELTVRAEAFLAHRPAWTAALTGPENRVLRGEPLEVTPDTMPIPHLDARARACMQPLDVQRRTDGFMLGRIFPTPEGYTATRQGHQDGEPVIRDTTHTGSLDAAMAWIRASPHAPDIERFPCILGTYGQVLWTMPGVTCLGVLEQKDLITQGNRFLLYDQRGIIARVSFDASTRTWAGSVFTGRRVEIAPSPDMMAVFGELHLHLTVRQHESYRPQIRQEADQAVARMRAFIDTFPEQLAAFDRGCPA